MKYELRTALLILSLFFLAEIVSLFTIEQNIINAGIEAVSPSAETSAVIPYMLPISIIIITVLFLLFLKLRFNTLIVVWYSVAFVMCVSITLGSFINEFYAVIIAVSMLLLRFDTRDNFFHNMMEILVYAGLSVILVSSLDVITAVILLVIISIYDIFAVNYSKHMIRLAKSQLALNIFSGFKIESNGSIAALGGGDVVFPALLAGVMLRDYSLLSALIVCYGSLIGLIVLILTGKENKVYPAMPFITAGCILGLVINFLLV